MITLGDIYDVVEKRPELRGRRILIPKANYPCVYTDPIFITAGNGIVYLKSHDISIPNDEILLPKPKSVGEELVERVGLNMLASESRRIAERFSKEANKLFEERTKK